MLGKGGAAAVRADACHHLIDADNCVAAFIQLVIVALCRKFFLGILGYVEREVVLCGKFNTCVSVAYAHVTAATVR